MARILKSTRKQKQHHKQARNSRKSTADIKILQGNERVSTIQSRSEKELIDQGITRRSMNQTSSVYGYRQSQMPSSVNSAQLRDNGVRIIEEPLVSLVHNNNSKDTAPPNDSDQEGSDDETITAVPFFLDSTPANINPTVDESDRASMPDHSSQRTAVNLTQKSKRHQIIRGDDIYLDDSGDEALGSEEEDLLSDYLESTALDSETVSDLQVWLDQATLVPYDDSILDRDPKDYPAIRKQLLKLEKRSFAEAQSQSSSLGARSLRRIDDKIQAFVRKDHQRKLQLQPLPNALRAKVKSIAAAYGLELTWEKKGDTKTSIPQLRKTKHSSIPQRQRSKGISKSGNHDQADSSRPEVGAVVGSGAAPINESNVGHRMLTMMGWKQGEALGTKEDGIRHPIEVIVRKKRTGLGVHD